MILMVFPRSVIATLAIVQTWQWTPFVLLIVLGEVILFLHLTLVLYLVFLASAFQLFVVLYEEPVLRRRYGAAL